ncbi:hypothetical protein BX666DRAFT_1928027 [Dichotomocladium elegans]|nr:hypothetical protein BX666DRAFT_1928027 [Dichotomocladium elegans]
MSETALPASSASKASDPFARIEEQDLDDGPLFRATVTQLEGKTSTLKQNVKRILRAANRSLETKQALLEADAEFVRVLRDIPCADPLFTHYLNDTWPKIHEQWERLEHSMQSLLVDPLQKLYEMDIKAAETHKRQFEEESKDYYAHLSKYLKKSSSRKDDAAAETTTHTNRKRHFDLCRFDYYSFLMDLHGGKKYQEILYHLLSYQQKQFAFYQTIASTLEPYKHGLDELAVVMADASREQNQVNKERYEKRKQLELKIERPPTRHSSDQQNRNGGDFQASSTTQQQQQQPQPSVVIGDLDLPQASEQQLSLQQYGIGSEKEEVDEVPPLSSDDRFRGIRDLQQQDRELISGSGRRKEGFLFATSKPSKNNTGVSSAPGLQWHKYWCVLSGGQLHEYSNWKGQLQTHIDPINLRFATAREARHTDRRFCFEIITTHFRRVYQATSQEEMQSWVATINNAIESLLNGMGSSVDLLKPGDVGNEGSQPQKKRHHVRTLSGALRSGLGKRQSGLLGDPHDLFPGTSSSPPTNDSTIATGTHYTPPTASQQPTSSQQQQQQQRFRWSTLSFGKSTSINQQQQPPSSSYTIESAAALPNTQLLSQLKQDPSNAFCAECKDPNPEWCSLNLGIVLCIECSGIHRSLGTHISKVRSLTLDSTSYTPDIVALLRALGNERSNAIWAANATVCPKPDDPRNVKLKYIQAKYVDRAFVDKSSDQAQNPQALLFQAINHDDIPAAMLAIALGADVNACQLDDNNGPMMNEQPKQDQGQGDNNDTWSFDESSTEYAIRYPLQFALLHGRAVLDNNDDREHVFPMAELLFQNGVDTSLSDPATGYTLSELVGLGELVEDEAIQYVNTKIAARGQTLISRSSMPPPQHDYDHSSSIGSDKIVV